MIFDKWLYRERILLLEHTFLKHEISWINRLSRFIDWNSSVDSVVLDDYVKILSSKGLVNFRQELGFILKFIDEFENISSFTKRHFFRQQSLNLIKHRKQILPTSRTILELLEKSDMVEKLFVLAMCSSGRRAIDFINLKAHNVTWLDNRYFVTLEKDKMNRKNVKFSFIWDFSLELDWSLIDDCFRKLLNLQELPFISVNLQKVRRRSAFHLHGLRNRKSMQLVRSGLSVEEVKSVVGWSSDESFLRYSKVNLSDIKRFESLDFLINYLNSCPL